MDLNGSSWGELGPMSNEHANAISNGKDAGLIEFSTDGDGRTKLAHTGGPYCWLDGKLVEEFREAAGRLGWAFEIIAWDARTERARVRVDGTGAKAFQSIDTTDPKGLSFASNGLARQRWPTWTADKKAAVVSGVDEVLKVAGRAMGSDDLAAQVKGAEVAGIAIRAGVAIEAQVQADEHLDEKHDRLNRGLPTEAVKLYAMTQEVIDRV